MEFSIIFGCFKDNIHEPGVTIPINDLFLCMAGDKTQLGQTRQNLLSLKG